MTLGEYLSNPYGKGAAVSPTSLIRDSVERELRSAYPEPIQYMVNATKDRRLLIHVKLPSRTKKGVYYDIVIELDGADVPENSKASIAGMPFRVFSNSPSFYYTYAKVFEEKGLFCSWLKGKYERKIMRKDPEQRNPSKIVGYERTVYTSMWYVFQKLRSTHASDLLNSSIKVTQKEIASKVQTQDQVEYAYEHAADTEAVRKKKEAIAAAKAAREEAKREKLAKSDKTPNAVPATPKTTATPKTATTSKTKKTNFLSKIKKLGRRH